MEKPFDVAIIGGGINGCGCAADAALRGLSVVLIEKGDLASQTSSSSSKLIHGGLRYLEQYAFSLVKKALDERQVLLNVAPHLVKPLKFILPEHRKFRSRWFLRLGLFLYDHLSIKNQLPKSKSLTRRKNPFYFKPLIHKIQHGFSYYDGVTDDARLSITNALQAKKHGATILTYTELTHGKVEDGLWHLTLKPKGKEPKTILAKTLINATGPWVESINKLLNIPHQYPLSLIKGSHIVVKRLYEGDHAYVLQNDDQRIVFTIPYFGQTLIGTTDIPLQDSLDNFTISEEEIDYLLDLVKVYFGRKPDRSRILISWSGVRSLLTTDNMPPSSLSRDYQFDFSKTPAPSVTIYSGKITTYRRLAKEVIDQFKRTLPHMTKSKTKYTLLPGAMHMPTFADDQYYAWLDEDILNHYLSTYGALTEVILEGCTNMDDLGEHFLGPLFQREVDYLIQHEWATSLEDILWRRTKLGLLYNHDCLKLKTYLENKLNAVI